MEKTFRMSLFFDFYGPLLTKRQQDVFHMYFHEDLSLAEVGEQLGVSRQAIYDILKRAGATLEDFENKLGLVKKHDERQVIFGEILDIVEAISDDLDDSPHLAAIQERIEKARATS